jgi:hypothetical protein
VLRGYQVSMLVALSGGGRGSRLHGRSEMQVRFQRELLRSTALTKRRRVPDHFAHYSRPLCRAVVGIMSTNGGASRDRLTNQVAPEAFCDIRFSPRELAKAKEAQRCIL